MAYPELEFGREHTALSRSINLTIGWFKDTHCFRINNNLPFWMPYQEIFAAAVAAKTDVPAEFKNVNSFLDGTQKAMCRPSDGAGRVEDIQRQYYSGYYRKHGFKMQSLMYPNGKFFLYIFFYSPMFYTFTLYITLYRYDWRPIWSCFCA